MVDSSSGNFRSLSRMMSRELTRLTCPAMTESLFSGRILLCVLPSNDADPLHSVKWHPKQPDTLAVASETNIYLVNIHEAANGFGGEPIVQADLHRIGQVFPVPSVRAPNTRRYKCS